MLLQNDTLPDAIAEIERVRTIARFRTDVIKGLSLEQKAIPAKYFYDEKGSQLFDRICELDEYYPTRTEIGIMQACIDEIVEILGSQVLLVEYGSGSSLKTRILLENMDRLAGYIPIDISREHLFETAKQIREDFPGVPVYPVHADYTSEVNIPADRTAYRRRVVYFPGSTIGNFDPDAATAFLCRMARMAGRGGGVLIGVDLRKDVEILEAAYNDREGVTAAFNLNLLQRINRELGADFKIDQFEHRAFFNESESRIEMRLVSRIEQTVSIGAHAFVFDAGESIHTENSYKYTLPQFAALARRADLNVKRLWTDSDRLFSVQYLTVG